MANKKVSIYDKIDSRLKRIAATVSASIVIIGAAVSLCSWLSSQVQSVITTQISDFRQESQEADLRQEQAVTRVELVILIEHDPENKVAIERMAKYYFIELKGDRYMEEKYGEWADKYGGDISFLVGETNHEY